jgi:hypothetical protein
MDEGRAETRPSSSLSCQNEPVPPFYGIVIEQSLADPAFAETLEVVHRQRDPNGTWVFLVVRVEPERLAGELERIRDAFVAGETWYAHFFSDDEVAVVFPDAIITMTTDPVSWTPAIEHGLALGISIEELDFWPHTVEQTEERFGISLR